MSKKVIAELRRLYKESCAERDQLRGELEEAVAALRAADSLLDGIRGHDHEKLGVFCFSHTNPVHLHVKDVLKRLAGGGGV